MLKALGVLLALGALVNGGIFAQQMLEGDGSLNHVLAIGAALALAFVSLRYLVFPSDYGHENDKN